MHELVGFVGRYLMSSKGTLVFFCFFTELSPSATCTVVPPTPHTWDNKYGYHNTIASRVGFWLSGENLGGNGKIFWVRQAVRAYPSPYFGLVASEIVNV